VSSGLITALAIIGIWLAAGGLFALAVGWVIQREREK